MDGADWPGLVLGGGGVFGKQSGLIKSNIHQTLIGVVRKLLWAVYTRTAHHTTRPGRMWSKTKNLVEMFSFLSLSHYCSLCALSLFSLSVRSVFGLVWFGLVWFGLVLCTQLTRCFTSAMPSNTAARHIKWK